MKPCELESKLECIHLPGVCPFRNVEYACETYRHYIRDLKPITPIEMAQDYEDLHSGIKGQDGHNK